MTRPDIPKNSIVTLLYATRDGAFCLDILVDGQPYHSEPFDTEGERQRAHDDLLEAMRSTGGVDMPGLPQ